jgi:hypothetical protein
LKKHLIIAILTLAVLTTNAAAIFVPDSEVSENRDGRQQIVKTYALTPDNSPDALIEEPFERGGYTYTFASITKAEKSYEDKRLQSETVTVNTAKSDLGTVLDALAPTLAYDSGGYSGTLTLDHTSIVTEATGYSSYSYTVTDSKTYDNLDRNDPDYIPQTTVKDGRTLTLSDVSWSVQGSGASGDVYVPTTYVAVATYSGSASGKTADGYVTTATYSGEVATSGVKSIVYTVTYYGEPVVVPEPEVELMPEPEPEQAPGAFPRWLGIAAICVAALGVLGVAESAVLLRQEKRKYKELWNEHWFRAGMQETETEVSE